MEVCLLTIALISQKGGVGKSTLAVHIAAEAARFGRRTLLVDLDPQASSSMWAERRGDLPPDVVSEHPVRLAAALKNARDHGYEVVVLDTAPHADQAALQAARVADLVLVPCRPALFDLMAIRSTLDVCDLAKAQAAQVVLNAAPIRSRVVDEAQREIVAHGGKVAPLIVRQRVAFQHCLLSGQVASEFEPGGPAATEIADLCKLVGLT